MRFNQLAITYTNIIDWVDTNQPIAKSETDHRVVCCRAYYAAYHACRNILNVSPVPKDKLQGGIHKRYVAALKSNSDKKIQSIGRKLDIVRVERQRADYELHDNFSRGNMTQAITTAKEILFTLNNNFSAQTGTTTS